MKKIFLIILFILVLTSVGCLFLFNNEKDNSVDNRKEEYYNNVSMYVRDVMVKINDGIEYKYNSTDTMLFIPAGNKITCVSDNILNSPFGNSWKYIYVGVYFNGEEYLYSVGSKDEKNYAIDLITQKDFFSYDYNKIDKKNKNSIKEFIDNYKEKSTGNKEYSINDLSKTLKSFIKSNYKKVKKVVFIDPNDCSYE